jgi:hypothetical protein
MLVAQVAACDQTALLVHGAAQPNQLDSGATTGGNRGTCRTC